MDWANERYAKIYTRDTVKWHMLGYDAQSLFMHLTRVAERAGLVPHGGYGCPGVAQLLRVEPSKIEASLDVLVAEGVIEDLGTAYLLIEHLEAQDANANQASRSRNHREKVRSEARLNALRGDIETGKNAESEERNVDATRTKRQDVTLEETPKRNAKKKRKGETPKRNIDDTPSLAEPSLADLSPLAVVKHDIPPSAPGGSVSPTTGGTITKQTFIDSYHTDYLAHWGHKPDLKSKSKHGMISTLCKKHGPAECIRRCKVMFAIAPEFPAQKPDIQTLVGHWDKLADAPPSSDPSKELWDRALAMENTDDSL